MESVATPSTSTIFRRLEAVQRHLASNGWDAAVVLSGADIKWLTGLSSSNAAMVFTSESANGGSAGGASTTIVTDFRYVAEAQALGVDVRQVAQGLYSDLGSIVSELMGSGTVAYEPSALSHRAFLQFTGELESDVVLRSTEGIVASLREVKDAAEVAAIARAAELLHGAYSLVEREGLIGRSERDVAWAIERHLREAGASALSFDSIVAGGTNGAFPHHSPSADLIPEGTLVTIDIGCVVDGYCSDCTRTFATGELSPQLQEIYDVTLAAQVASLAAVQAGAVCRDIDSIARTIIKDAGYGDNFGHGLGHGVGMQVHEGPRLSQAAPENATLVAGNVVTVEPGIYVPEVGGVRIEDLVVVRDGGHDCLTSFPKNLIHVN